MAARAGGQGGIVETALRKDRRVAGGEHDRVALAQRHVEPLGQMQHHLAAGLARPLSMKLRCFWLISASSAQSSCDSRRR